jgi:hypothetical protein
VNGSAFLMQISARAAIPADAGVKMGPKD